MNVVIKNGQQILIRSVVEKDASERHHFFVHLSMAQIGVVHTVDETTLHTEESEQQIKDFLRNHRGLWLVAVDEHHKIVGEIDITVKNLDRIRHNGFLTMGILPEYQGLGLGTAMMKEAISWAIEHKLLRIELSVFKNNLKARKLYTNYGFVIEGLRKNYLKNEDGSFEDDCMMAKYLDSCSTYSA
jgi:ribosomal protein S18 acetylase RimI-like enzyme